VSAETDDERISAGIRAVLDRAVRRLSEAGARDEALAMFVEPRRVLLFTKDATMVPIGRVWRLGVLLLDRSGGLYATGSITRAVEPGRAAYQSLSAESRREYRAAAFRGPFDRGETVNFDAPAIPLTSAELRSSTGPLFLRGDQPMVRWNTSPGDDAAVELDAYLADRVELLIDPPEGA
jgi:hypothetical protein